jgi:hypothetical protein
MNKWTSLYPFNVENWCESLAQWTVTDARGSYKPCTSYAVIPISVHEATCLLRGFRSLLKPLERAVTRALPCRRFFKLSTRSPKDAWMVLSDAPEALAIHDDDDQHVQIEKLQKQQAFMGVRTFADVCNLVRSSIRLREDLQLYVDHAAPSDTMAIILQDWRPSAGLEYRCFVKTRRLIACCLYHGSLDELLHDQAAPPTDLLEPFIDGLSTKIDFQDYVLDVYVHEGRVYFIELNPFSDETDPIRFTWVDGMPVDAGV